MEYQYKKYYFSKTSLSSDYRKSPSICFGQHSWFVPESSKLDLAHLLYLQGFVVPFPTNTRSSEVVSNLNFIWPLKSQVFSAFEPIEQIGKLCSPAKNRLKPGFCAEKSLPSERCHARARAIPSVFGHLNQPKGGVTKD